MATKSVTYHLMNADTRHVVGVSPCDDMPNGQVFTLPKKVEKCPWKTSTAELAADKWIPAGKYKVVSRKFFRGGSIEIAPV